MTTPRKPYGWHCLLTDTATQEVIHEMFTREGPITGPEASQPGCEWRSIPLWDEAGEGEPS